MGGMGQQRFALSEIDNHGPERRANDETDRTDLGAQTREGHAAPAARTWQQQPLLAAAERARGRAKGPSDRIRQAGLMGVAQARAALAEAARRAETRTAA